MKSRSFLAALVQLHSKHYKLAGVQLPADELEDFLDYEPKMVRWLLDLGVLTRPIKCQGALHQGQCFLRKEGTRLKVTHPSELVI